MKQKPTALFDIADKNFWFVTVGRIELLSLFYSFLVLSMGKEIKTDLYSIATYIVQDFIRERLPGQVLPNVLPLTRHAW